MPALLASHDPVVRLEALRAAVGGSQHSPTEC
jgi:hypothetical protein